MKYEEIELTNNEAIHNFELIVDGYRSYIEYLRKNDKYYLVHTGVPEALEGKGVGTALLEKTLQYLEEKGQKIVPMCTFIQLYLKRHPEWNRVVA
ncbi:MAG: N-acetyltransferase [Sphingobacteriales bacterium]|nr:MAG: N-acetyltransferase [Sphingobacteriales bacterium]